MKIYLLYRPWDSSDTNDEDLSKCWNDSIMFGGWVSSMLPSHHLRLLPSEERGSLPQKQPTEGF